MKRIITLALTGLALSLGITGCDHFREVKETRREAVVDAAGNTNWIEYPVYSKPLSGEVAIQAARNANSSLNPTPFAPLVDWALLAGNAVWAGLLGWQTKRKRRKEIEKIEQEKEKETAYQMLDAVIEGVEHGSAVAKTINWRQLKEAIDTAAKRRQVGNELHTRVRSQT